MRKNPYNRILRGKLKKHRLSNVPKSCHFFFILYISKPCKIIRHETNLLSLLFRMEKRLLLFQYFNMNQKKKIILIIRKKKKEE